MHFGKSTGDTDFPSFRLSTLISFWIKATPAQPTLGLVGAFCTGSESTSPPGWGGGHELTLRGSWL